MALAFHLESENDCPNEAQCEPRSAVNNVLGSQVLQMDMLVTEELECLVHILQAMNAHFSSGWPREAIAGKDLQGEGGKLVTIMHRAPTHFQQLEEHFPIT
jgi:hypothetical protein